MEIITPRTDKQKQVTCPTCGAVIGYYESEVKYWIIKPYWTRWRCVPGVGFSHIVCPSCGDTIRLD